MKSRHLSLAQLASALLALSFVPVPAAFAQAAAPADSAEPKEPVLVLSPFEVVSASDKGYIATRAIGATKTNTPMIELPHSIQVLNSEFIADTGSTSIFQAARFVSNVTGGSQRGDDALLIRGFSATRLRNGQPYTQQNAFTFDEMAAFDRVEVIKGASAVLYGSSSPGGLINLVDKRPEPVQKSSVSLTAGSWSFMKAVVDTTGPVAKLGNVELNYRAIAAYEDSESWREFAFRERAYLNGSLEARLSKDTSIITRMEYQQDDLKDSYGKPYIWFSAANVGQLLNVDDPFFRGDPDIDKKKVERFIWDTTVQHYFNENWSAKGQIVYGDAFSNRTEVFISAQGPTPSVFPRFAQVIPRDEQQLIAELDLVGKFKLGPTAHQLLLGGNFSSTETNDSNFRYNVSPSNIDIYDPVYGNVVLGAEVLSTRRVAYTETEWKSYFIQDQIGVFDDRLQFIFGFRKDELEQSVKSYVTGATTPNNDDQVSPRYGVLWRITPEWSLYGSYNESFIPASGAGSVQGVPFPSPTAEQLEAGVKFELFGQRVFGGASIFQNVRRNQTTVDVLNPGFSVATGEITSEGVELDFGVSVTPNWQIIMAAGFLTAEITEDNVPANVGLEQPNVPNEMASLWTKYDFPNGTFKGLSLGGGINYVGDRAGARDSVARSFGIPGYTTVNGLIAYAHGKNKYSLNVENITDERYIMNGQARLADPGEHLGFRFTYTRDF